MAGYTDWLGPQPQNSTEGGPLCPGLTPQSPFSISGRGGILGVFPQFFRGSDTIDHLLLHRWGWGGGQRRGWCRRVTRVILGVGWGVVCKMAQGDSCPILQQQLPEDFLSHLHLPKNLIIPKRYCHFSDLGKQLGIVVRASGQRPTSKSPPQLALPIDWAATAKGSKEAKIGGDGRLR